jgi:transposase-like protein
MSKHYSTQIKQETVHYVNTHPERSIKSIATELDISYSALKSWCREARLSADPATKIIRTTVELERENKRLNKALMMKEKEIDILKKFSVYLAKLQP